MKKANADWQEDPSEKTLNLERKVRQAEEYAHGSSPNIDASDRKMLLHTKRERYSREGDYQNLLSREIDETYKRGDRQHSRNERRAQRSNTDHDDMEDWEDYPGHREDNMNLRDI